MTPPQSTPDYLRAYAEAVQEHGATFEAMLWRSPEAQRARFRVAAEMADPTGRVIADLGCGLGDFAITLDELGYAYGAYVGVEGVPELAEGAREHLSNAGAPDTAIMSGDFVADAGFFARLVGTHDVESFYFSGSLNTLPMDTALAVLDRAWTAATAVAPSSHATGSTRGVLVFNFLSDRVPTPPSADTGPATRFDTLALLDWAMGRTPLVRFRADYWNGHDATIAMVAQA